MDHNYWAFIPNPLINLALGWEDTDIPVVANEQPSWLPGPYDN